MNCQRCADTIHIGKTLCDRCELYDSRAHDRALIAELQALLEHHFENWATGVKNKQAKRELVVPERQRIAELRKRGEGMILIGRRVEILPAYNHETGERDIFDEVAGLEGHVVAHGREGTGDHLVQVKNSDEHWIYVSRLRQIGSDE